MNYLEISNYVKENMLLKNNVYQVRVAMPISIKITFSEGTNKVINVEKFKNKKLILTYKFPSWFNKILFLKTKEKIIVNYKERLPEEIINIIADKILDDIIRGWHKEYNNKNDTEVYYFGKIGRRFKLGGGD